MSVEAEMSVIGCMMLDEEAAKKAVDMLAPEMFSHDALRKIFSVATDMYWDGEKLDAVSLIHKLPPYKTTILKLAAYVPTWSHLDEYMKIVIEDWRRQEIKNSLMLAMSDIDTKTSDEITDFLRNVVKKQDDMFQLKEYTGTSFHDAAIEFMEWIKSKKKPDTVLTGFRSLDRAIGGFMKDTVTALCARAGHGKTDFALNLAVRMAKRGYKIQYFSMEMPNLQLMQRIVSQLTHINSELIRDKKLTEEELQITDNVLNAFKNDGKVSFVDDTKLSTKMVRHYVDLYKPDCIFIDHLGLMERPKIQDQVQAIGEITRELKLLAKEKHIAIIELSQMNRKIEERNDKKPNLADIRGSGNIEQDADYVMFVQSENLDDDVKLSGEAYLDASIYLKKNRHGCPGRFQFHWQPQYHSFYEIETKY